jgi:hypothetical protein
LRTADLLLVSLRRVVRGEGCLPFRQDIDDLTTHDQRVIVQDVRHLDVVLRNRQFAVVEHFHQSDENTLKRKLGHVSKPSKAKDWRVETYPNVQHEGVIKRGMYENECHLGNIRKFQPWYLELRQDQEVHRIYREPLQE